MEKAEKDNAHEKSSMCRKGRGLRDEIDRRWKRQEKGELKKSTRESICMYNVYTMYVY